VLLTRGVAVYVDMQTRSIRPRHYRATIAEAPERSIMNQTGHRRVQMLKRVHSRRGICSERILRESLGLWRRSLKHNHGE
jgi:hypothetical protein